LQGANLERAAFDYETGLNDIALSDNEYGGASVADVHWNGVNLAVINWSSLPVLGDEIEAWQNVRGLGKERRTRRQLIEDFQSAVRAYRQLAAALREQGLNEDADRYAYRAQLVQRRVYRRQRRLGRTFGSWVLDLVAGYGYKPMRSVFTYILVITGFAFGYFLLGGAHGQSLTWNEVMVVSMTAFHGRGFFGSAFQPGDPQAAIAAIEALIGLLIEITFIATFTQRFFAR
jgi:hypothetical protein